MSGAAINQFSGYQVFPKYVAEDTLKRARIDGDSGTSIRVTATNPEPTPADLSTLESTTGDIKTAAQAISDKVGFKSEAAWDGEATSASLIQIEKKAATDGAATKTATQAINEVVGTSSDTSSDSTVIGLLKSIASKLQ